MKPGQISSHGIERPGGVGEEGGEQEQRHRQPSREGTREMDELEARRLGRWGGGVETTIPKLVEAQGQGSGDQGDKERFLGGVHEPPACAGQQGPAELPAAPVTPAGGERQERKEDQQDFVNVIAAVEDYRRGYRREKGSPKRCLPPQAVGHERQEQDQADTKENRDEPEPALGELIEIPRR